jgi:CheY-like chemotaxis protein
MTQILIADDHPEIRRILSISLGKSYEILESEDGGTALEMIRKHRPKVALLDVMMPGELNGLQVLEAVKSDPTTRHIVVAMVTARGQISDSQDASIRGADAYFIKPFSPMLVAAWIREQVL